jgi:hypothetical protein
VNFLERVFLNSDRLDLKVRGRSQKGGDHTEKEREKDMKDEGHG